MRDKIALTMTMRSLGLFEHNLCLYLEIVVPRRCLFHTLVFRVNVNVLEAGQYQKRVTTQAVSDLRKLVSDLL
jgi:hypothetical protein